MAERQLATIRTVSELRPIPDADAIEAAQVDGWVCVVKKGEFQVGDRGVYFEIDSLLPLADERFAFLQKGATGKEFYRLRTMKLRKQLSQGLLMPITQFPEAVGYEGDNLAERLGIAKYEPPIPACLSGKIKGGIPSFIRKTDEERIQNLPELITQEADSEFEITVKLDGSSMTVFHKNGYVGVCSRNLELVEDEANTHWRVANRIQLPAALRALGRNLAVQGELMGPSIQGNREGLKDHDFFAFNVFDIDKYEYLPMAQRAAVIAELRQHAPDLRTVPFVGVAKLAAIGSTVDEILKYAEGPSLVNPMREGLVFKRTDGAVSFKAIANAFLLAEK